MRLSDDDRRLLRRQVAHVRERGQAYLMEASIQHGRVTTWEHSVGVATTALAIAAFLRLRVRREQMVRAALLHDYFLYDWHEPGHTAHATMHPVLALRIAAHMWPLPPGRGPTSREALLVSLADKWCSAVETIARR